VRVVRRIAGALWEGAFARKTIVEELKGDPGVADDGLIGIALVGTVVAAAISRELIPTLLAPVVTPLAALFAAFVLRLIGRIARHPATLAETTATVTLPCLPLLLLPIPVVGGPIGVTWWVLAQIFLLHRIIRARIDAVAVIVLLGHALVIGVAFGVAFAVETLR
jgi:hypothetical protein